MFTYKENEHYEYPQLSRGFLKKGQTVNIDNINNHEDICIYIHVPFCRKTCTFCNYYKVIYNKQQIYDYCNAVITELYNFSRLICNKSVSCIHFGGGSPSVLDEENLNRILNCISTNFILQPKCEISFEGNIIDFSKNNYISMLKNSGVNRISFGIQTFQTDIRKKYGLPNNIFMIDKVCDNAQKCGLSDYNADLMYGFPEDTMETFIDDIERAFLLDINTLDLYMLNIFPNTALYDKNGKNNQLCEKNKMKEYLEVYNYIFQKQDYNFLMSNTITKSAKRCSKYLSANLSDNRLKESNVLGIGASSRGRFGLLYYKNTVDINEYMRNVKKNGFSIECKQVYQKEDMEDRLLVMFPNFTKIEKIEVNRLQKHRIDQLNNLVDLGFVLENEHEYYLDATGMFFAGNISKKFYSLKERKNTVNMVINNLKHKVNFYNQDNMQINQEVR